MNKEQIQQKFEEFLKERFHFYPDGSVIGPVYQADLSDVIEYAFNFGLEVAADNADADFHRPDGQTIECYVLKNSILKFKL